MKRRERTHLLIELGGLVQKAGLVDLTDDDRAILYGAFLTIADKLRDGDREQTLTLWRRRGKRAFDMEAAEKAREPLEAKSPVPPSHPASRPSEAPR
jgi:hypothetical protein